jgi:F-type H+-transporting ATPase subunit delta
VQDIQAARRYAQAIFDLAVAVHKDHEFEEALVSFSEGLKNAPQAEKLLCSPSISLAQKAEVLERIFHQRQDQVQVVLLKFFGILLSKSRFDLVHEIARLFKKIADAAQKEGIVEIRSACEVDSKAEQAILAKAQKIAGYRLRVKKELDPSILGGIILKINNKILDGSVIGRIRAFCKDLTALDVVQTQRG